MDIPAVTNGPTIRKEGLKTSFETKPSETSEETVEEEKSWSNGEKFCKNLKRSFDEDLMNSKKRRKQLKPIRIATNLEDMVKVPKQIIGLNNDLDIVNDLLHTVPIELSSKSQNSPLFNDVQIVNPPQSETSVSQKENNSNAVIDSFRGIENPKITDLNVPTIETGPNYLIKPHFIFPLSFQPMKNPSFWSEANLKIFNQEAYCELCKKEFCNKYFLKTHKANKHGIYLDVPASSISKPPQAKIETKDDIKIFENGKISSDGECTAAFCDLCNKKFCNKYFVRRHKNKSHGLPDDDAQSFQSQETESKTVQKSLQNSTKTDSTLIHRESLEPLVLGLKRNDEDNFRIEQVDEEEQESPLNLIINAKEQNLNEQKDFDKNDRFSDDEGDECSSENIEKLQTMLLRLNPSEIEVKTCRVCNEPATDASHKCTFDKKDKDYLSDANESSDESKGDYEMAKNESHEYSYLSKLDHLKQAKPTSSYCEICNKELCNKYFMRTHMQRMHGIEIEHGTQIGGVVCNICNKELCSKYFLRVHKQNTHGILNPGSSLGPSTSANSPNQRFDTKMPRGDSRFVSSFTQVCYVCNKRFRSSKWLQAHFLSDHREEAAKIEIQEFADNDFIEDESTLKIPKKNSGLGAELGKDVPEGLDVISKIFWENTAASKIYTCSQCQFTTSVLAFLFVHERSHFVVAQDQSETIKPSVSLQNLIHDKTFWQHKISQQMPECLDLSASKPNCVSFEKNGS